MPLQRYQKCRCNRQSNRMFFQHRQLCLHDTRPAAMYGPSLTCQGTLSEGLERQIRYEALQLQ